MERTEYLLSPRGAYSRYLSRKRKRTIYLKIDGEPLTKKSMKPNNKIDFQNKVLDQLKTQKKRGFSLSTKVCVEMDVFTNNQNPPHIHKIPKNYLDLLSKPFDPAIKRKKLIFEDDQQVKYLNIRYHIGSSVPSGIWLSIFPFSHFIEDIRLAHAFINGEIEDSDDLFRHSSSFRYENQYDKYHEKFIESIEDYNNFKNNVSFYSQNNLVFMEQIHLHSIQENFFKTQDVSIADLYTVLGNGISYTSSIKNYKPSVNYNGLISDLIVKSPFNINLPSVPIKEDESDRFKSTIKSLMSGYRQKYWFLATLYVPVFIKVFYKPPLTNSKFNKDLDNLMRIIVPYFHEEFKPPVSSCNV